LNIRARSNLFSHVGGIPEEQAPSVLCINVGFIGRVFSYVFLHFFISVAAAEAAALHDLLSYVQ
jgi:hypothetical protein